MKPNKNDPHTHLRIIDHILSEFMFIKEPIDRSKPLTSAQSLLLELELERVHSAHCILTPLQSNRQIGGGGPPPPGATEGKAGGNLEDFIQVMWFLLRSE